MTRRFGELIDVRSDSPQGPPRSFLWRGRIYLVRDVLDHWWERQAWWATPAAAAVHGDGPPVPSQASGPASEHSPVLTPGAAEETTRLALGTEREIWRVEAARGRQGGFGVFDLCHDHVPFTVTHAGHPHAGHPAAGSPARSPAAHGSSGAESPSPGRWHLVRVGD